MMTKDEIKAMIAETIQTNNKKAITAQSLANVLTTMAENSGEGGGGLKFSEERTLYGINEEVLTDEQKAYNAETYKKISNGEAVTINMGGYILPPTVSSSTDDFIGFTMMMKSDESNIYFLVKLQNDGSVEVSYNLDMGGSKIIFYGDPESAKAVFADPMFFYKRIKILYLIVLIDVSAISVPVTTDGITTCALSFQHDGNETVITYNVDTGEIISEETSFGTLTVYIDVSDTESVRASYNKDAVSDKYTYKNLCVVHTNFNVVYNALQTSKIDNNYIQVVIYRNSTFETWKINADGTSTLVTA